MTTWYIKSGESGGGTSTEDYAGSWGAIDASLADGDTVSIHGSSVLREQIALTADSVTVAAEPGTGRWTQTGRRLAAPGDWNVHTTVSGRTIYKHVAGATVVGFVYDYRLGTAEGVPELYVGHVPETAQTTLANFVTDITSNDRPSWFYNGTNQTLYAYFPGNDDPRSSGKDAEWLAAMTDHGFRPDGCTGLRLSGGRIDCWWDNSASNYWGLALTGCTACLVEDMEFSDCYFHSAGCTGGVCAGNVFSNITCRTVRRGTDSHIVQFAGSGNTLAGGVFRHCTLHLAGSRDYNGDPLETAGSLRGVAGHAGGTIAAGGLIFRHITTVRYADEEAAGGAVSVVHSGGNAAPTDAADPATYPILHEDCVYEDFGAVNLSGSDSHAAFRRCRFVTDGTVTNGAASTAAINVAAGCKSFFESCTVAGEMSATTNHILLRAAGAVSLSNCSVRAAGATDAILFGAATADIDAVHCLFVASSSGRLCRGGTMPQPVFTKCWYDANIGDTLFAVPAAFNSQSEWASAIDPGGTYDVDFSAAFADADTLEPAAESAPWSTKDIHANPARPRGINGNKYAGSPGAWQARPQGSWAGLMGRGRSRDWRSR